MTTIQKYMFKKAIPLLYQLIKSRPKGSIFKTLEIYEYINKNIWGQNKIILKQLSRLH